MSLSLMKHRINQSGDNLWEEQIIDGQKLLDSDFKNDVSYNPNIVDYYTKEEIPIKIYGKDYSSSYGVTAKFLTSYKFPVDMGDLFYDKKTKEYWMCVEGYNVSDIHYDGVLAKCNRFIKWQDKNFNIHKVPVIVTSASKYNNGENANQVIVLGSDQLLLFFPLNEETLMMERGMKFFIDENNVNPTVYEVTRVDTAIYSYMGKGFMAMIVTECAYSPTQKELDLGVCNYVDHKPIEEVENVSNNIAIISGSEYIKIGLPCNYIVTFKDKNGNDLDWNNISFNWKVESEFEVETNIEENEITLTVPNDASLIGSIVTLYIVQNDIPIAQSILTVIERF